MRVSRQDKKKITKLDDLPRYTYPIDIKASELLVSESEFNSFSKQVRKNIQNTLDEYEIEDKTTLKGYYATLRNLDMLEGNFESAMDYIQKILSLQEKPADKLMSGMIDISIIEALQNNESIVTSGNYQRYFEWQGKRYSHILDPNTGYPANSFSSVTVIHNDATTADAAATALLIAGPERWEVVAKSMGITQAFLIDAEGKILQTKAMAKRVKLL